MKIVLVRHGQPDVPELGLLRLSEFQQWVDAYNQATLVPESQPSAELKALVRQMRYVCCSDLPRAVLSAQRLLNKPVDCVDARFREAPMPQVSWPSPPLPTSVALIVIRLAWMLGLVRGDESRAEFQQRARVATDDLVEQAKQQGSVLLVGHGLMNRAIAKQLSSLGWQREGQAAHGYWGVLEYHL